MSSKTVLAQVVIETGGVAGEVGLDDIEIPVAIVIRDRHAHAGLRLAVRAVGHARLDGDLGESAVVIVLYSSAEEVESSAT